MASCRECKLYDLDACKKEICGHPDPVYSGVIPPRDTEQSKREERFNLIDPIIDLLSDEPHKRTDVMTHSTIITEERSR